MIPQDKCLHIIVGVMIFAITNLLLGSAVAMAVVTVVAAAKEVYDYFNKDKHTPDVFDFLATVAGGLLGLICSLA